MTKLETKLKGRPKGVTYPRDALILDQAEALMAANPGLKLATALRRLGEDHPANLRRLNIKYKERLATEPA